jgi:DNA-binding transcriptional ArsR family regulator
MTNKSNVLLGYEVGSGHPVTVPFKHTVITGQSQEAGKTTATEALISRSGMKALAFITKRGEGGFKNSHRIDPYFFEQADWKFVASVLEAHRGEKLKFERAWIIRASKGATTLKGVQRNVKALMEKAKGMSADVYLTLDAYLADVVPQIDKVKWANKVELNPGINVMDLTHINIDMQHLVIKSSLDWVLEHEENTIVIVPEAWKFIPEGRGTPVKLSAEAFIRQGAGLKNYLWIDSQDIAGVEKIILKSVPLWILGVQREENEVKRTLKEIPAGIKRPKSENIAHLELGQFYACWGKNVHHTYVRPAWMEDDDAIKIALGKIPVYENPDLELETQAWDQGADEDYAKAIGRIEPIGILENEPSTEPVSIGIERKSWSKLLDEMEQDTADIDYVKDMDMEITREYMEKTTELLERLVGLMENHGTFHDAPDGQKIPQKTGTILSDNGQGSSQREKMDLDTENALFERFVKKLAQNKALLKLSVSVPEIEIETVRPVIQMSDTNLQGWLVTLISKGFFDQGATGSAAYTELIRLGRKVAKPGVYGAMDKLAEMGIVTKESDGGNKLYRKVENLKITRKER